MCDEIVISGTKAEFGPAVMAEPRSPSSRWETRIHVQDFQEKSSWESKFWGKVWHNLMCAHPVGHTFLGCSSTYLWNVKTGVCHGKWMLFKRLSWETSQPDTQKLTSSIFLKVIPWFHDHQNKKQLLKENLPFYGNNALKLVLCWSDG